MSFARPLALLPIVTALAGCAFGLVYFAILRRTVVMLSRERRGLVMAFTLGRLGAAIVFFLLAARLDALALLTALGGFLSARVFTVRAERGTG
jgi:N-ATPase, AtpR subunit